MLYNVSIMCTYFKALSVSKILKVKVDSANTKFKVQLSLVIFIRPSPYGTAAIAYSVTG